MVTFPGKMAGSLIAALWLTGTVAHAETQLFDSGTYTAWLDLRLATANGERDWLDGGFGKLRYGDETKASVGQAALLWKPQLTDTLSGYVLLQGVSDAEVPVGIEEAYIQWRPVPKSDFRYGLRAGQMFPPVSMEHDGTGWTPSRTITPSAINSWIGEEVLVRGLEVNAQKSFGGHRLGLTLGGFTRDDTAGTLLSWRGWALHDISSADNSELMLPDGENQGWYRIFGEYQAEKSRPMVEVDGRLGYYVRLDWKASAALAVNVEFYDNQGDSNAVRNGQWAWGTRFYNLGIAYRLTDRDELLSQYMVGHTITGWQVGQGRYVIDAGFESAYLLLTHKCDNGSRLTGRLDYFAVKDWSRRQVDDNSETGYATTLAWLKPVTDYLDIALEGLYVISDHPARFTHMLAAEQAQTQVQLSLKLHL